MSVYEKLGTKTIDELPLVPTEFSYSQITQLLSWQNNNTGLPASGYTNELQILNDITNEWDILADIPVTATTCTITGFTAVTHTSDYKVRVGVRKTAGFIYPSLPYLTPLNGSRIFAAGTTKRYPYQYLITTGLPLVASGSTVPNDDVYSIAVNEDYLFAGNAAGRCYKYNMSDLSYVDYTSISSYGIFATTISGDYVYIGKQEGTIVKYRMSDMSLIATSPSYGGGLYCVLVSGNYIYGAGNTTRTIRRYNLSDLTYTSVASPTYGGTINSIAISGNYIYAAGATTRTIRKYNLDTLTYVDESASYGGDIYDLGIIS